MRPAHKTHAIAAVAALFALPAGAQAQTPQVLPDDSGNTLIIVVPPDEASGAPGSTAVFTPIDQSAPNAAPTRAEVKAEAREAVQNGEVPRGELGQADASDHGQAASSEEDLSHRL